MALKHDKPVRIGVNWGSLDQELLTRLMDENSKSAKPLEARAVTHEAMVQSALLSAERAEEIGLPKNRIILSAKVSAVQDLIAVYGELARRSDYALHLGLTEAGMGSKGIVASSAAMGVLLQQGIGDTVRVSLTPEPNGDRTLEVQVAQELLQTMGLRTFVPLVAACPGCGRTTSTTFQELASDIQGFIRDVDAGLEDTLPRRRDAQRRGDGLHRQRAGRIQARRHRHLAARHRRAADRAGVRRRQEGRDLARADADHRLQADGHRLHRAALRHRSEGRGVKAKPFIVGFLLVVAFIAAFSIYLSTIVDRTETSISAVLSPDKKMKAVKLTLSGNGRSSFCVDSISVMLAAYPDEFAESRKEYELYSAPCGKFADGAPSPKIEWLSATALQISYAPSAARTPKLKEIDVTKSVHVTFVARQ